MSSGFQVSSAAPNFQPILDKALKEYKKKTGKELTTHALAQEIKGSDSPEAILTVLQGKANELNQSQSSDERLTKWLTPTVTVLNALSATLGEGIGALFPPTKIIFSGISILLVAAKDTAANREALIELFDKVENFFLRLRTYTQVPPTPEMTNVMGKIMAEVLSMLAIATKEMRQGRTTISFKKLVGRTDTEDALLRLDKLEQGELRTVTTQVLAATNDIKDGVKRIEVIAQRMVIDVGAHDWERVLHDLRGWLTPPDPSTSHNIACSAQHERTAAWVFNEDIFKEWESLGSLLWIHGKAGSGKSILCSAIIQHVITLRDAGSASVAYFYFDFKDVDKKHRRNLLPSLLIQLSSRSETCLKILSRLYLTYMAGKEQPSEHVLVQCLKDMLTASSLSQLPTYIILDALDECPNTPGIPTPRDHVLRLVKDLIDLRLPNLHICVTSRPEIDIRTTLEPLTSGHFSLHDQPGQKNDIAEYVNSVVQSDTQMNRWREDDRKLVTETLSEKADGMFRWVFCQLELLKHCLAPSLRSQLNELPKSLDETYERVLKEIQSTNQGRHAHRLLQCLSVAVRPLHVKELAEVLAFDLDVVEGEIPRFHAEWRWKDQEQAVLSACSSLKAVVDNGSEGSRVVQFSHFSVKEFLTSDRLAAATGDISRYHILPEPAHLILAQACLGVLLSLDNRVDKESDNGSGKDSGNGSLLKYAAEHWPSHTQVGNASSCLKDTMETLFDLNKPYFLAWLRIHDIDFQYWRKAKPLYYSVLCGFYDLVRHLIAKHPEHVIDDGGYHGSPLYAALSRKHLRVAELLVKHGAHVRGTSPLLRAATYPEDARVDATQFPLRHGASVGIGRQDIRAPLHQATEAGDLEIVRILLERRADVDLRNDKGQTPLHSVSSRAGRKRDDHERSILARLLLESGADVNAQDKKDATPLHYASCHGRPEIVRLLLDNGANAHAENVRGWNPLHEVSRGFHHCQGYSDFTCVISSNPVFPPQKNALSITRLLLEHGVDVNVLDKDQASPLHIASSYGKLEIARLLLDRGAIASAKNVHGRTPLHLVSRNEDYSRESPDIARLFLELGADVNTQDNNRATPLHLACYHGNFETALVLLDRGAEVNAQNADGQTPLHWVSQISLYRREDDPRVARLMLERGADVGARDKDQKTPLHLAAYGLRIQTAQVLLEHGANVNAENVWAQTPLHSVTQGKGDLYDCANADIVRLLLKQGADVNARDRNQETPLHSASSHPRWNSEVVRVLFDNGAQVNAVNVHGQNALHLNSQASYSDRQFAKLLLELGVDVNAGDKVQKTPLQLASYYGNSAIVEVLLDNGARADAEDIQGRTPLHQVLLGHHDCHGFGMRPQPKKRSRRQFFDLARLLLKCGADANAQDKDCETPLHLASRLRLLEMARILLEHGADVDVKNHEGKSPLQLASGRKRKALKRLLSKYPYSAEQA